MFECDSCKEVAVPFRANYRFRLNGITIHLTTPYGSSTGDPLEICIDCAKRIVLFGEVS